MKIRKLSNRGASLVTVILVMLLTMTFAGIVLTYVTSQSKTEITYENNLSAIHAAEAGLNKYLWYMNKEDATEIALDTDLTYPEYNPVAGYRLHKNTLETTENKIVIEATGWMLNDTNVRRTVKAAFTQRSFPQYVYLSDNDPDNIWWMDGENCYGPYHSNTKVYISGSPRFYDKVTYVENIKYQTGVDSNPYFKVPHAQAEEMRFPADNLALKDYANQAGGYYFTGRTSIKLMDNKIKVWNQSSIQIMDLPSNGVIYVDDAPWAGSGKFHTNAGNVFIHGVLDGRLTIGAKRSIYITGYDPTIQNLASAKIASSAEGVVYKDTSFTLLAGGIPSASVMPGEEGDMLGLIANNNVEILTYGWFNDDTVDSSRRNITIHAALFAMNGSFGNSYQMNRTENFSYPNPGGTITLRGAIIQDERGPVGVKYNGNSTGYTKDYAHDPRMKTESPPHFLMPEESGWEISEWAEIN